MAAAQGHASSAGQRTDGLRETIQIEHRRFADRHGTGVGEQLGRIQSHEAIEEIQPAGSRIERLENLHVSSNESNLAAIRRESAQPIHGANRVAVVECTELESEPLVATSESRERLHVIGGGEVHRLIGTQREVRNRNEPRADSSDDSTVQTQRGDVLRRNLSLDQNRIALCPADPQSAGGDPVQLGIGQFQVGIGRVGF